MTKKLSEERPILANSFRLWLLETPSWQQACAGSHIKLAGIWSTVKGQMAGR